MTLERHGLRRVVFRFPKSEPCVSVFPGETQCLPLPDLYLLIIFYHLSLLKKVSGLGHKLQNFHMNDPVDLLAQLVVM